MVNVVGARTDEPSEFFKLSLGARERTLHHHPLLVLVEGEGSTTLRIERKTRALLDLPDNTRIVAPWPGQWTTDYFTFTAGDYKRFVQGQ